MPAGQGRTERVSVGLGAKKTAPGNVTINNNRW